MAFTGQENHKVDINEVADMTATYRYSHVLQPTAVYFSKAALNEVLQQNGCVGARFYFAMDGFSLTLAFVGVTSNENDIVNVVCDAGLGLLPHCGTNNAINS